MSGSLVKINVPSTKMSTLVMKMSGPLIKMSVLLSVPLTKLSGSLRHLTSAGNSQFFMGIPVGKICEIHYASDLSSFSCAR